jgi:hypothetical protein
MSVYPYTVPQEIQHLVMMRLVLYSLYQSVTGEFDVLCYFQFVVFTSRIVKSKSKAIPVTGRGSL